MSLSSDSAVSPETEAEILNTIERWVERDLKPIVKRYDHANEWPSEVVGQMRDFGLFGATIGQDYGGLGWPATTYAKVVMKIAAVWMSVT